MVEYQYYTPNKVIENGEKIYASGEAGSFLIKMPQVADKKTLIGILVPVEKKMIAVEISNKEIFNDFKDGFWQHWFCYGGRAYLYTLPQEKANTCKKNN